MRSFLSIISFVTLLAFSFSVNSSATSSVEIVDMCDNSLSVTVSGSTLHVSGASGLYLYVYNVAGVRVKSVKVEGDDKFYSLNLPKGCYIVKVGDMVRKISIS